MTKTTQPSRQPLELGMLVAERFMRIDPPRETYMYHLGIQGLLDLYIASGEGRLLDFVLAFKERRYHGEAHFDWRLYQATGDAKWLTGLQEGAEQWMNDPRRDKEGALLDPRGRYTIDIVSGLATVPIIYGHLLKDGRFFDEAFLQLEISRGYLEEPATGLWYNRWGHGLHPHRPNPGLWGRGNGWLVNAWGRVMHLWDPAHPKYAQELALWQKYCRDNAAWQTAAGCFRQLMIRPWSFEDVTATGLIGSGIAYGVLNGTLPAEMAAVAYRAVCGLDALVDDEGNNYNTSTTAGGYNFERQYESAAIFNDPHGDGTLMGACAAVHQLLQQNIAFDRTPPAERPIIVNEKIPDCISFEQEGAKSRETLADLALRRLLALPILPATDRQGCIILGLLHWYDLTKDRPALNKARTLLNDAALEEVARLRLSAELARRTGGAVPEIDAWLTVLPRDRESLILDTFGGYEAQRLYHLLPLLGMTGRLDDACTQALGYQEWLQEPITGLWHSAYGRGQHLRRVTPGFWTMGNAYVMAGVADLLEYLPANHPRYVDIVCLLRDLAKPLHEWLPVVDGWTQITTDLRSFRDAAANGLLTYAFGKSVLRGWIKSAYTAATVGGLYHLGKLIRDDGAYQYATLPTGGLDTEAAYQTHRVENDPYALGFVLSACATAGLCEATGINYGAEESRLGAR